MSVVVVQHVPGEAPYAIATALEWAGLRTRLCRVWEGDPLPDGLSGVEALVVMGGPMSAYSDNGFPTRDAELALLRAAPAAVTCQTPVPPCRSGPASQPPTASWRSFTPPAARNAPPATAAR
ncbi:hypothetical protein OG735_31750 [Streptomyces sp. NBC_01210]|uniref:hypothetical protein n=1 Tax=Streptomyces sp. NBC_01210 TaxID=2903774 RepID=UPI002E0EEBEC|nr:hypothetical protein OG735_31750 [Streptomyces sp. NBC_01210]